METFASFILAISAFAAAGFSAWKNPSFSNRTANLSPTSSNYRTNRALSFLRLALFVASAWFLVAHAWGLKSGSPVELAGRDVVFVIDVSKSMDATDGPNGLSRLDAAKAAVERLVRGYPNNRYSLYGIDTQARVVVPATRDSKSFLLLLNGLSSKYSGGSAGTDPVAAMKSLSEQLKNAVPAPSDGKPGALAVVFSDGGDAEDTPKSMDYRSALFSMTDRAEWLAVGVGTTKGSRIPIGKDMFGNVSYLTYQRDEVVVKRNDTALRNLADATDGTYEPIDGAYPEAYARSLSKVPPTEKNDGGTVGEKRFPIGILAALAMLFLSIAIPDKTLRTN